MRDKRSVEAIKLRPYIEAFGQALIAARAEDRKAPNDREILEHISGVARGKAAAMVLQARACQVGKLLALAASSDLEPEDAMHGAEFMIAEHYGIGEEDDVREASQDILETVRSWIKANLENFRDPRNGKGPQGTVGYLVKRDGEEGVFGIMPEYFRRDILKGRKAANEISYLISSGLLMTGHADNPRQSLRLPDEARISCYFFRPEILA